MWKTFKTVYGLNNITTFKKGKDKDGKDINVYDRESVASKNGITVEQTPDLGDEGIIFILNKKDDHRFDGNPYGTFGRGVDNHNFVNPFTKKWVPNAFVAFQDGKYVLNTYTGNPSKSNVFCGINKTADGTRTGEKGDAHRDVIMARTGETYLVKAEAQVRLGKYQDAISTVNVLRARGQWKDGEDRGYYTDGSMAFLKADGGKEDNSTAASTSVKKNKNNVGNVLNNTEAYYASMTHKNTYYLSTGIDSTTAASNLQIQSYTQLPPEDEAILAAIGASGDYDRMLNFIFNERTRAKAFNPEAAPNIQDRHIYRPIPQKFIDTLQNEDGTNLSDADKKAWQNPGY